MDISNITNCAILHKSKQIYTKDVVRISSINRCNNKGEVLQNMVCMTL